MRAREASLGLGGQRQSPRLEMIRLARPGSLHQRPIVLKTGTDSRKFKSMTDQPYAQTRFEGFSHRVARYNK